MSELKVQWKRLLSMLCITSLLIPFGEPLTAQAYMKPTEAVTEFSSSTLPDDDWTTSYDAKIEDGIITFDIGCPEASTSAMLGTTWSATMMVTNSGSIEYADANFPSGSGSCSVSMDLSEMADGLKSVYVDIYAGDTKMYRAVSGVTLEVANGEIGLYSSYGQAAIDDIAYYNEKYAPELYMNPATGTALNNPYAEYEDFINKAEEITAGCTTDIGKIEAIYDWMCTNMAYDYEALNSTSFDEQLRGNDEGYMLTSMRGMCGAFMDLALILFRAAGIPSATVDGYAKSSGLDDSIEDTLSVNHGWLIIYYEGSWHYVDPTWGCQNKYYGEGNEKNVSGKAPNYRYLGTPAAIFGETHYEQGTNPCPYATGLQVTGGKTQYLLGEEFSKDYSISYIVSTGGTWKEDGIGLGECTGYDMNTLGKQTVTVSYRGFTGTYEIEVLDAKAVAEITAAKTKTTYELGDTLDTDDITVTAVCADKTTKEITDFTVDASNVNMKRAGEYTITVSGEGRTAEITITVNPHIVKFDANGGTVSKNILKFNTNNATIGSLPIPKRDGYIFKGWYTAKTGGTMITATTKVTKNMVVYAQWRAVTGTTEATGTTETTEKTEKKVSSVNLVQTKYTYTGNYIKPAVTVKNTDNEVVSSANYTVLYSGNLGVGTAKATIIFKGDYANNGKVEKTFTISPKGTKIAKIKAGKKKLTIKVKAQKKQTSGYQIRYSTKKNMKGAKIVTLKKNTKLSSTISKLKAKKKYYVQVRTYKKVSGKNYYSSWSKAVSKKTK